MAATTASGLLELVLVLKLRLAGRRGVHEGQLRFRHGASHTGELANGDEQVLVATIAAVQAVHAACLAARAIAVRATSLTIVCHLAVVAVLRGAKAGTESL